jgi:hypothetical protein
VSVELRVAIAAAVFMFTALAALVTTGAVVVPPRLASEVRTARWRWAPTLTVAAALVALVLLPTWLARALCGVALCLAGFGTRLRPRHAAATTPRGRRVAPRRDAAEPLRLILLAAVLAALACAAFLGLVAVQAE